MTESNILKVSILVTASFALLGIVWGIIADSGMIIFDGAYSLISVGLSVLSLIVLNYVTDSHTERFPFGKAHFEPLLIVFKSLMLIAMCGYSSVNAMVDILEGGRAVAMGAALLYALISIVACLLSTLFIMKENVRHQSGILEAEKNQWLGDTFLSVGVFIGFAVAYFLQDSPVDWIVPYADPLMVVLASSLFILFPLKSLKASLKEVLYASPGDVYLKPIEEVATKIAAEINGRSKVHLVATGRELSIEVNILVKDGMYSVHQMDDFRHRLAECAERMGKRHWVNMNITAHEDWM